jgi:energy-coupling factor transporter ATP-binding protein EcfA2
MSHLTEFSVEGLAGREETYARKRHRHVNVFFGANGSGKTSLFKIFHSAMSEDASILRNVRFQKASVTTFSVDFDRVFTRTIAHKPEPRMGPKNSEGQTGRQIPMFDSDMPEVSTKAAKWDTVPKAPKTVRFRHRYLPISRLYSGIEPVSSEALRMGVRHMAAYSEEELDRRFASSLTSLWASYSADISKAVTEAQQKGLANILRAVLSKSTKKRKSGESAPDLEQAHKRVASFLAREKGFSGVLGSQSDFAKKYAADANLQNVVTDIEEVETRIEKATAPREKLRTLINSMYSGGKAVLFSEKEIEVRADKSDKIDLRLLSSGEKQLLYIFVETLMADYSTILIDEPEMSMHVDWQKNLVKSMRILNPRAQIVLATHSPEIMADLPDSRIFRI